MPSARNETRTLSARMQKLHLEPIETVPQAWVYGFWFKSKHMRRLARSLKLNWDKNAFKVTFKLLRHVLRTTRVYCTVRDVTSKYRGQNAMIMTIVESHGERKLDDCEFTPKQMDRVRKAMGLPSGTRPKWYEVNGSDYASDQESDSEDEEFPYEYTPNSIFEHEPNHVVSDEFDSDEDGDVSEDIF